MDDKTRAELGGMSREDLQKNFLDHFRTKLDPLAKSDEDVCTLSEAMNTYSPHWGATDAICEDALLETLTRLDVRMDISGNRPASRIKDVFDASEDKALLGREYLEECFERALWDPEPVRLAGAGAGRGGQPQPFNEPTYGFEVRREYDEPLRLSDVVARRVPITGDTYRAGILETPEDTRLRKVGEGADLPRFKITTSEKPSTMEKIGYGLEASYEFYRGSDRRMDVLTEAQRQKAQQVEIALIDEALELIGTGGPSGDTTRVAPTAVAFGAAPTVQQIINLHIRAPGGYRVNTVVGTLDAVTTYLSTDVFFQSNNRMPGVPDRNRALARFVGPEIVDWKTTEDVPSLTETNKPVMLAFDRRKCIDYIVERRGMVSERSQNESNQTVLLTNSHSTVFHVKAEANQCRFRVVFG